MVVSPSVRRLVLNPSVFNMAASSYLNLVSTYPESLWLDSSAGKTSRLLVWLERGSHLDAQNRRQQET